MSTSFKTFIFFTILLTTLLICVHYYFDHRKHVEQNHKISSMLALVSTLADELNIMKQRSIMTGGTYDMYQRTGNTDALINVSDDEEDDEEDEDEEQEENDYYGDEDIMDNIILEEIIDNVGKHFVVETPPELVVPDLKVTDEPILLESETFYKTIVQTIPVVPDLTVTEEPILLESDTYYKTIVQTIPVETDYSSTDYSSLTVLQLRQLVAELVSDKKIIVADSSKLKKAALIKLLVENNH